MHGLQGSFPRCRKCLPSNPIKKRLVIESIILIHIFCTDLVGFNQIATVFDLEYERVVKLEGYDRISQYYYCPGDYNSDEDVSDREYLFDEDKLE